jgi:hypothetical protein
VKPRGLSRVLRGAQVTADRYRVGTVVCVRETGMKQAWCLATSTDAATAKTTIKLYGRRWGIESGFRDTKDLRFGMGMATIRLSTPERRDRLLLLNAFAVALLTLLGAAGEALGYDRMLKVQHRQTKNTLAVSARMHALRVDPNDARDPATSAHRKLRRPVGRTARVRSCLRATLNMRGVVRGTPP